MRSKKDPKLLLEDILESIDRIERYVAGMDRDAYFVDEKTMDAVERNLERISEAAIRLNDDADRLCPGLPWDEIRGIGNILRHAYDNVRPAIIWETVQNDLRPLQLSASIALSSLEDSEPGPEPG